MKLTEKISWLVVRVQRSLFPHLSECVPAPLTEQEKRLVSILEIVEVERHVPGITDRYRYPGRKPLVRQRLARASVANVFLLWLQTTYNQVGPCVRGQCALSVPDDQRPAPSLAIGSQPAQDMSPRDCRLLAVGGHFFAGLCHICRGQSGQRGAPLVAEHLPHERIGCIRGDSTAIVGREKPAKKIAKKPEPARKRGRPAKGEQRETATMKRLDRQVSQTADRCFCHLGLGA